MTENTPLLSEGERLDRVGEHIRLIQRPGGLCYGTDAFLLAAFVNRGERLKSHSSRRAAELGGGTGIISLLCASHGSFGSIDVFEIQPTYAEVIARNAAVNGLDSRIRPICRDIRELSPKEYGTYDAVFSNPPYTRDGGGIQSRNDERRQACHEINGGVRDFCAAAARLLNHGGVFYSVYRPDRLPDLFSALREFGLEPKVLTLVCPDASSAPSLILTEARRGGAPGLKLTAPLIMYTPEKASPRTETEELRRIYRELSF